MRAAAGRTTTAADLLDCQQRAAEYVAAACDATGTSAQGLEPDDIFGSAAAARDRELAGQERRLARLAAIDEPGRPVRIGPISTPTRSAPVCRELRMHVGTGWAILTELGADQATGAPVLIVTTTRVDLTTGELSEASGRGDPHGRHGRGVGAGRRRAPGGSVREPSSIVVGAS